MLILLRVTMQPLVVLLNCQLDVGSLDWELKQQAQNALYLASPDKDAQPAPRRHYQATISADGLLEKQFFAFLSSLFQNPLELIEEQQQHVSMRALAFKLLSRQGALVYDGLTVVHRKYPIALFKLLQHPEQASVMFEEASAKPCMLDSWTAQMVKQFPGFMQPEFFTVLEGHAQLYCISTAAIEARHSSLRRTLLTRTQTWTMPFATLSSDFLAMQLRRGKLAAAKRAGSSSTPSSSSSLASSKKRKLEVTGGPTKCH
eukprot:6488092-Amphidinium_carterae.1